MWRLAVPMMLLLLIAGCGGRSAAPSFVVFFTEFSTVLDEPAQGSVAAAAKWAQLHPGPVVVAGYADPTPSPKTAADLSRARAQVVVDQLVRDGVPPTRISREAKGSTDFTLSSQESRRVEIRIAGM
jgi:outer membrane protein OmpA-like peptidoglycan-associated protein